MALSSLIRRKMVVRIRQWGPGTMIIEEKVTLLALCMVAPNLADLPRLQFGVYFSRKGEMVGSQPTIQLRGGKLTGR